MGRPIIWGMNWTELLRDLSSTGLTQVEIAAAVGAHQSTISDLARGKTATPSFEIGDKLRDLHKRVQRRRAKQKAEI